jgi:arsenate reductase
MYTLLHNPKCSKSRQSLKILEDQGVPFQVREYLLHPLDKKELADLLKKLGMLASAIIRFKESIIEEKNIDLSDEENCLQAILKYPQLLERPILIDDTKAVIGRPPENLLRILVVKERS